jgi:mannose-6-phosphate isomerase-like protein (cupin superfamily)
VVSGTARVTKGEEVFDVHRMKAHLFPFCEAPFRKPRDHPLQIIEVQNGDYVEENDIERFDDEYQRTKK